jgi:hypothetical protein
MTDEDTDAGQPELDGLRKEVERLEAENLRLEGELQRKIIKESKPFSWRNLVAWILVVIAFIMAIGAVPATWAHDYLLDTERFVDTVAPLIKEEEIARAISERAADILVEELDVEDRLKRALPEEIDFIAGPVSNGVQSLAQRSAEFILTSEQFYWVWERLLRASHATAIAAVRGEAALKLTEEGDIVLDLGELLRNTKERLVEEGLTFLERVPVPEDTGTVVLFTAEELGVARGGVHFLDILNWVLPALALLLFAAAVIISTDRRRFLMASGICIALAMAISLIALNYSKNYLLGQVEAETNLVAAQLVWTRVFHNLVSVQAGILALGVVVAAGAALAGPYRWAIWMRTGTAHIFEDWRDRRRRGVKEPGPVGKFLEAHKMAFRVGGLALAVIVLLLLPKVTAGAVIGAAVALVIYLAAIELLRSPGPN